MKALYPVLAIIVVGIVAYMFLFGEVSLEAGDNTFSAQFKVIDCLTQKPVESVRVQLFCNGTEQSHRTRSDGIAVFTGLVPCSCDVYIGGGFRTTLQLTPITPMSDRTFIAYRPGCVIPELPTDETDEPLFEPSGEETVPPSEEIEEVVEPEEIPEPTYITPTGGAGGGEGTDWNFIFAVLIVCIVLVSVAVLFRLKN